MPHFEQTTSVENENTRITPERNDARFSENIQEEEREDVAMESAQAQKAAEQEAALVLERIKNLPEKSAEKVVTSGENVGEYRNEKLEAAQQALDDIFSVAKQRSPSKYTWGEKIQILAHKPKNFFVEKKAFSLLLGLKEEIKKALVSPKERGEAMSILNRMMSGMDDNEDIEAYANRETSKRLSDLGIDMFFDNQGSILEFLNDPDPVAGDMVGKIFSKIVTFQDEYANSVPQIDNKIEMLSLGLVAHMGLDPEKFYNADQNAKGKERKNYIKNILAAQALESSMPGAVRKLAEEYGIQSFARYPKELLIRQLEAEDDLETPYGIVLNPRIDWSGGFYHDVGIFEDFSTSARDEQMNVRVFECEGMIDATKKLIRLNRKYGTKEKIRFAIVGGHGSNDSLEFNQGKTGVFKQDDVKGKAMQELREFFSEDATIVLNSCSTGDDFGLGETMSRLAKIKVIAPSRPTSLDSLKVGNGGTIAAEYRKSFLEEIFDKVPEEGKGSLKRVYESGRLIEGERSEEAKEIEKLVDEF